MKKLIVSIVVVLAGSLAFSSSPASAGIVDAATPLRLKIATFDGNPKIKLATKMQVLATCSKDCNAKVTVKLITPASTLKVNGSRGLPAGSFWKVGLLLTKFGKSYLKDNYRQSRFKVAFSAVDIETGKRVSKTKTFKIRK